MLLSARQCDPATADDSLVTVWKLMQVFIEIARLHDPLILRLVDLAIIPQRTSDDVLDRPIGQPGRLRTVRN
jgi:hypothetical protein